MVDRMRSKRKVLCWVVSLFLAVAMAGPAGKGAPAQVPTQLLNDRSADMIGATPLWVPGLVAPLGLTGQGQMVGLADSGLDGGSPSDVHPDLQSVPGQMPKVALVRSWAGREVADDPVGHGTHMAATIAGTGAASDGKYRGIAPGASLYVQGLLDREGKAVVPARLADLFEPAYAAGVRVHVDGWGAGGNSYSVNSTQIDDFVRRHPDFLPIFGAGNSGPRRGTLTAEANSKNALVVGASQTPRPAYGPDCQQAGEPASFSSCGPTADGRVKPDLVVPASAVVSARSRYVKGNFAPNAAYTRLGGTSMAAAIAGGAAALLEEYVRKRDAAPPSAALLKALLINGARPGNGDPSQFGFGVLDIAGTVLALQEKTVQYADDWQGVAAGEAREFHVTVSDRECPLKVTLAWTDPAGAAGGRDPRLVNDLDLEIIAPDGHRWLGNAGLGNGADTCNNVEQVLIPHPLAGDYVVRVKGSGVTRSVRTHSPQAVQDFALVYGQVLRSGTVAAVQDGSIKLADGVAVPTAERRISLVVDGKEAQYPATPVPVGSDCYWSRNAAYLFARTWQAGSTYVVPARQGVQVVQAHSRARDGGFYLDAAAVASGGQQVRVNGVAAEASAIPSGAVVSASVSPSRQTLWSVDAWVSERAGTVYALDPANRELRLVGDEKTYRISPEATVSLLDTVVDCAPADAPYGSAEAADLDAVAAGADVALGISPSTGEVLRLVVHRRLALGRLSAIDVRAQTLTLDTGRSYRVLAGAAVSRDGRDSSLAGLEPGDFVRAVLLPGTDAVIQATADSRVVYGRVLYASQGQGRLHVTDQANRHQVISFSPETPVFHSGREADTSDLASGDWVRVVLDESGMAARKVDVAQAAKAVEARVAGLDPAQGIVLTEEGGRYQLSAVSQVTRGGIALAPQDLVAGERIRLILLPGSGKWEYVVAGAEAKVNETATPALEGSARQLSGVLVVQGRTTGDRAYLYRQDGSRAHVPVDAGGSFSALLPSLKGEDSVHLVALDTRSGGLAALRLPVAYFVAGDPGDLFPDISGLSSRQAINRLLRAGVVQGYPDGSFRPAQAITRLELVIMLARARQLVPVAGKTPFADWTRIPTWARGLVAAAYAGGILAGYPDGTFKPYGTVSGSEAAVLLERAFPPPEEGLAGSNLGADELAGVPAWAIPAVIRQGLDAVVAGRPALTRGEAAELVYRALERAGALEAVAAG